MKKISIIVSLLLALTALYACSLNNQTEIPARVYTMESSDEVLKPSLMLKEDGSCYFDYSSFSSYLPIGTYEIDGDIIKMITDDGENIYIFDIRSDKLYFNESQSSPIPGFAHVPDGAEFE